MNPKKIFLILVVLSIIPISGMLFTRAQAQGVSFSESFDDPNLTEWEHSPEVIVADGVMKIGPGNFAARMGNWQDLNLTFRIRFSGIGETAINYRNSDTQGYMLLITPEEVLLLRTTVNAEPNMLAHATLSQIQADTWMDINIQLSGGEHRVIVNGADFLQASDPNPLPAGGLVFTSNGERTTELDSVSISQPPDAVGAAVVAPVSAPTAIAASPTPTTTASGSWQALLSSLITSQGSLLDPTTVLINMLLAVITSFILSRVYIFWGSSLSNRRKFAANFMLITVTTTFIILVVRSSVALSLGLVGALSIVRFRAAIKEPEELAYLFFAISLGIGLGDNQRVITLLSMVVVIALIGLVRLFKQTQADANMHMEISSRNPNKVEMPQVMQVLEKCCSKLKLLRYDENEELLEMSFIVEFEHTSDLNKVRSALNELSPNLKISFLDNKGIW
jgi:uncharacterized membrane protein YhiD involved in acid resistance